MNKKIAAAVTAFALTIGGLALAAPASADDATTQEVASSPDSTSTTPSSPTSPSDSPTEESAPTTPTETSDSPAAEPAAPAAPDTDTPAVSESSPSPEAPAATPVSESAPTSSQQTAPEKVQEWHTWLIPAGANVTPGHTSLGADGFPQDSIGAGQVAAAAGTCVQQDQYTGTRETLDALYAGPLTWNAAAGHASDNDIQGLSVDDWTIVCTPPVVVTQQCTTNDSSTSTNLDSAGWTSVDTRSAGHAEYVAGGLHIWTDDNSSNAKVSWAVPADFPLSDTGTIGIDYDATTGIAPGVNLYVNFGADGSGTLVQEDVYGQDLWLTNGSAQAVKDNAPVNGGGNGSQWHGTIDQWLAKYPAAQVVGVAFSLGSGVLGDGVIHSISTGCDTYAFDYQAPPVIPADATASVNVTAPTCDAPGVAGVAVDHAILQGELDSSVGTHTATFTSEEGHTFAEGATTLELPYEVKAATGDCPTTTPTPTPSDTATPQPTETPVAAAASDDTLAHTGSDLAPLGLIGGLLALAGLATVAIVGLRRKAQN